MIESTGMWSRLAASVASPKMVCSSLSFWICMDCCGVGVVPASFVLALAEALVSTYLPGGGGLVEAVFFLVLFLALVGRAWREA